MKHILRNAGLLALLLALMLLVTPGLASAQTDDPTTAKIAAAKHSITTVQRLEKDGIITPKQAQDAIQIYLNEASAAAGHTMTLEEVMQAPEPMYMSPAVKLTKLQVLAGYVELLYIIVVLAALAAVGAILYLFGSYVADLLKLFKNIPLIAYEVLFYAASIGVLVWAWTMVSDARVFVAFLGCLLLAAAFGFTGAEHKIKVGWAGFWGITALVWGVVAVLFASSLIGFFSVGALLSALGFSFLISPLCYAIGFKDEASVGRATVAAFAILIGFVVIRIVSTAVPYIGVFEYGSLFLGSFVGYLGLLIVSSKMYPGRNRDYWFFFALTFVAGLAAIAVGSIFRIPELQRIGGTFFVLFLLEKMMEVPTGSWRQYAVKVLFVAGIAYGLGTFALANQALLAPWLFMPA